MMSRKTRAPQDGPDLFSVAGLAEPVPSRKSDSKPAPPAATPRRKIRKQASALPAPEGHSNELYLRDREVAERYGISRQTVWRWAALGKLPKPVKFSDGATRWRLSDLVAHEASLPKRAKTKATRSRARKADKKGGQR